MDWSLLHALNNFLASHDAVEDPIVQYEQAAKVLFVALIVGLFLVPRRAVHGVHLFVAHAPDPGFPSDHATASFAVAVALLICHRRWGIVALVMARCCPSVAWHRSPLPEGCPGRRCAGQRQGAAPGIAENPAGDRAARRFRRCDVGHRAGPGGRRGGRRATLSVRRSSLSTRGRWSGPRPSHRHHRSAPRRRLEPDSRRAVRPDDGRAGLRVDPRRRRFRSCPCPGLPGTPAEVTIAAALVDGRGSTGWLGCRHV